MKRERHLGKRLILVAIVIVCGLMVATWIRQQDTFDFTDDLEETFVTIDDTRVTLQELSYYIMLSEGKVNLMAEVYDSTNTQQFWNVYTNHMFVRNEAKATAMNSCIRDNIYCLEAEKNGVTLTEEEVAQVKSDAEDVCDGLSYKQALSTKLTADELTVIMEKVALASKYANYLIQNEDLSQYSDQPETTVEVGGEYYEALKESYTIVINKKWDDVILGNITVEATTGDSSEEDTNGDE